MNKYVWIQALSFVVRLLTVAGCIGSVAPPWASAHPDVFMESKVSFVFSEASLKAVSVEFVFEKFYSQRAWAQVDGDHDGQLSPFELELCEELLRFGADQLSAMVFLWLDDQPFTPSTPPSFSLVQTNRTLGASVLIPCDIPLGTTSRRIAFCIYDDTSYVRITPSKDGFLQLVHAEPFDVTVDPPAPCLRIELDPTGPMNPAFAMPEPMEVVLHIRQDPQAADAVAATGASDASAHSDRPDGAIEVVSFAPASADKGLTERILDAQERAKDWLADLSDEYRTRGTSRALALMLLAAFVFGVVHAAGPGHGKTIAVSYLITQKATLRSALVLGVLLPFLHSGSGALLAMVMHGLVGLAARGGATNTARIAGELLSYSLVMGLGFVLFILALRDGLHHRREDMHPGEAEQQASGSPSRFRSPLLMALVMGAFPCPVSIIILEIFLPQGAVLIGLWVVFAQALGMAVTITSICCVVGLGTSGLSWLFGRDHPFVRRAHAVLAVVGAILVFLLGALFLWGGLARYGIRPTVLFGGG